MFPLSTNSEKICPPAMMFLAAPIPPAVVNAPVVEDVDSVIASTSNEEAKVDAPPDKMVNAAALLVSNTRLLASLVPIVTVAASVLPPKSTSPVPAAVQESCAAPSVLRT